MTLEIKDGIYHIPLELPWSSPGFVNVYLIDDTDGFIMIDCGVNGDHYFELLSKKLRGIDIKFNEIKLLIGTHMHSDHIGLSEKIREEGIPFALYENSIDFLNKYNDWTIRFKELKDYAITQGAPKSFVNSISEIQTPVYAGKVSKPDVLLKEGKIKNLNRDIETLFTPGHDITEISLHDTASKIIFSGDHILPKITPFIPTESKDSDMLAKYTESLDKVDKIKHDIIAPGHGDLISEPHNRIKQMKLHHKRRSEKILTILEQKSFTGWEMVNNVFPRKLDDMNLRLAFQETMAHLKYLENLGKVKQEEVHKVYHWSKTKQV